jgi:hypothetical protein
MNAGMKVMQQWQTNGTTAFEFDISKLPSGVYLLQIKTDNKYFVRKLIVH